MLYLLRREPSKTMASPVMNIVGILEDIKHQITDAQYKDILENLQLLHRPPINQDVLLTEVIEARLIRTEPEVTRLIYAIVNSKQMNGGKLAYVLDQKGHHYSDYYFESFRDWMAENGVSLTGNVASIVNNILF